MKRSFPTFIKFTLLFCIACACKKEYDAPPLKQANDGAKISIQNLKGRLIAPVNFYRFKGGDTNLYCTVISDEQSGNFYQQVFVQDEQGQAIQLNLKESGGLYTGDQLRVNLNNLYLVMANNMIYLDSVDVGKNVVKLSSGNAVKAKIVSLDAILNYSTSPTHSASLQGQLVQINSAEFKTNTLVPTFADAIGKTSVSQTISTCEAGKTLTVRTSGRSNFAGKPLPKGNGSIVGVVTQYNTTMQLCLRSYSDVAMNGPLCVAGSTVLTSVFLNKDFNDNNISSGGWSSYAVTNTAVSWSTSSSSLVASPYARISGYLGGNTHSENWLISPPVDLSKAKDPVLSFRSAAKYSGTALEVLISSDYSSGSPQTATWTSLAPGYALAPSSGDYLWTFSGNVALSTWRSTTTRVAFRYQSTTTGASSYQLDDIVVKER